MKKRITLNLNLEDVQQAEIYRKIKALGKSEAQGLLMLLLELFEKDHRLQKIEEQLVYLTDQQIQILEFLRSSSLLNSSSPGGNVSSEELDAKNYDLNEIGRYGFSV